MNASFEEKSVWIQLVSMVLILGSYFVNASQMMSAGVTALPAYAALFISSIVLLVIVLVVGHIVIAVASRPDGRDERDRQIEWRAEAYTSWIMGAAVIMAITGMVMSIDNLWIAHWLMLCMFLSEVARFLLQLVYYRRGMPA